MSTERGFRLPLAARIFLASGILVAIAVAAAALVTLQQGRSSGARAVDQSLIAADAAQARLEKLSFEKLDIVARTIALDADFARYVATATDDAAGTGVASGPDSLGLPADAATAPTDPAAVPTPPAATETTASGIASVKDLLDQERQTYGFGFGMVLDGDGRVVARTDEREAFQDSFSDDPVFGSMIENAIGVTGYWRTGVQLLQVSAHPIAVQGDQLVGFLIVGSEVNADTAKNVREISGGDVAYWMLDGDTLRQVATSLDEQSAPLLAEAILAREADVKAALKEAKSIDRLDLALGERKLAAKLVPLYGQPGDAVGAVLTMTSVDAAMAPFLSIQKSVQLGGIIALALALAVSWWLARRVLRPVVELTEAAEQAAGGNYHQQISIEGRDEVARLGRAFDSLLSDLREKKDIEGYVGHLSRFLPDPGAQAPLVAAKPAAKPVVRVESILLGLELRRFMKAPPKGEEAITLTALGQLLDEALARAQAAGGELLEQEGPRLLFGFQGEGADLRAIATVHAWWEGRIGNAENAAAAAIAGGEIVYGSLPARPESTATIGLPVLQVERLLGETSAGQLLMAPALGEKIKALGQVQWLKVAQGQSSGKRYLTLEKSGLAALSALAGGMARATVVVPSDGLATVQPGALRASDSGSTRLAMGTRFAGRYEILAILGAGGMGMVYKARDADLNDVVALKMLRPGMMIDAEQLDRLKSELKLARRITHPNVLRTFDFGDFQGVPYISMEYVRGLTLRYLLQQTGRLPFSAALRIARQLCMGLDAAHQVGVIHRDIKPENIIIEQSGNAKLMDFGIARPAQRADPGHTQPGTFLGTPNYASPEQLSGMELDQRSDIYSTGILLCEMFCGKLPFSGGSTMELYVAHLQQRPIKPSELWPDVPRPLEEVILKCLEKKPEDRYASAADLLVALSGLRA